MSKLRKYCDPLLLLCQSVLAFFALLTLSPIYQQVPHRDSGIFLFLGSQILHGKILYVDIWDHKQPLIYFLNSLGLWLGSGSTWGVWSLEVVLILISLALLFLILRKVLAPLPGFLITMGSFLTIYQIMSGNFSEEYAIFFQTCVLALFFLSYLPGQRRFSRPLAAFGIGLFTGLSFLIKQTYIDAGFAIFIAILFLACLERNKKRWFDLLWLSFGFLLINGAAFVYFYLHHSLPDYLFGAFSFNLYYSNQGLLERLHAIRLALSFISTYPFFLVMTCIWLAAVLVLIGRTLLAIRNVYQKPLFKWGTLLIGFACLGLFLFAQLKGRSSGMGLLEWIVLIAGAVLVCLAIFLFLQKKSGAQPLTANEISLRQTFLQMDWQHPTPALFLFIGLLDFPVVFFTIALSGENFPHYYISLLIPLILIFTAAVTYLQEWTKRSRANRILMGAVVILLVIGSLFPAAQVINRLHPSNNSDARSATAAYLKSATTPQDKILVWGYEAVIYFLADRDSPTRYEIQVPVYYASPYQQQVLTTILSDLQADPPAYIADTVDSAMPFIQGKTTSECIQANPLDGDRMHALLNYVCSHYEFVKSIDTINIYKRLGN
jgi:hypothetical protein